MNKFATDILAVSVSCMELAWSSDWKKDARCKVVFNALRAEDWQFVPDRTQLLNEFGWQEPCTVCLTAGRFGPEKNQVASVEVVEHLRNMGYNARLLLVGAHANKPYAQEVFEMVTRLGLEGVVAIPGPRTDIRNFVKSADVMLCPSRREGMPGVVLEACAAQTPVVASDIPAVREIAAHLEGISIVGLDTGVGSWSQAVLEAVEKPRFASDHGWSLEGTPFSIGNAAAALRRIYVR